MPNDVFIATDGGFYYNYLHSYAGNLYSIQSDVYTGGPGPTIIRMYKSTDKGKTWTALASTLSIQSGILNVLPSTLIGTKLYVYYFKDGSPGAQAVAYFDFTTDTFSAVATSGVTPVSFAYPRFVGNVSTQLYVGDLTVNTFMISQYSSFVRSVVGTMATGGRVVTVDLLLFVGASGILHILTQSQTGANFNDPSDLGYANVVSGVLSSNTIIRSNFSDFGAGTAPNFPMVTQAVQIGSNIYFSFYDIAAHAIKLMKFDDSASPTFTVSDIDPSFIVPTDSPKFGPTGALTNTLGMYGSTLYCFYANSSYLGVGDGCIYYRTSLDNGITWSSTSVLVQHIDTHDFVPIGVEAIKVAIKVGTGSEEIRGISYVQAKPNSQSPPHHYLDRFYCSLLIQGRFFAGHKIRTAKNYVF